MFGWLPHFLGVDDGSGPAYLWWSGFGANLGEFAIVGALAANIRRHNCHVKRCLRIGRHTVEGTGHVVCRHHHPEGAPTAADIERTKL